LQRSHSWAPVSFASIVVLAPPALKTRPALDRPPPASSRSRFGRRPCSSPSLSHSPMSRRYLSAHEFLEIKPCPFPSGPPSQSQRLSSPPKRPRPPNAP